LAEAEEKRHKEMEKLKMKSEAELYRRTLEEQAKLNQQMRKIETMF